MIRALGGRRTNRRMPIGRRSASRHQSPGRTPVEGGAALPGERTSSDGVAREAGDRAALYALTDRLYRAETADDVFEAALDAIASAFGCRRASILLFDADGVMRFVAARGLSDGYRRRVDGHSPWTPETADPQPIFVADIEETAEPDWLKTAIRGEGIRALAFIPLVARRTVIGKFMTYHEERHIHAPHEVELAVTIARQVGFAVERFRADDARRRAEDDLRLSEERFRILTEEAPVMLWTSDSAGRCVHLNRMLRRFWGVEDDGLAAFDWRTTLHPDDADGVAAAMMTALVERRSVMVKARYRRAEDATFRVLETTARPQFDADGRLSGMVGVNVDVTERDDAEAALRESERRFRDLAETMPQLVWTADASGRVDYWNSRIEQFSAAHRTADGALDWAGLIHPDDLPATRAAFDAAAKDGGEYQIAHRLTMRDGGHRWHLSRATPVRGADGALQRWYGTATDVHGLRLAEERRRESEQRQRIAAEAAGLGVFEWDAATDTAIWENERMYEIFGRPPQDGPLGIEEILCSLVHPEDAAGTHTALRDESTDTGDDVRAAFRILRPSDRGLRWLELAGRRHRDEAGRTVRLVGVVADVTDRRRAEEHRTLLVNELNHRVKNTLAVVQALAKQTFRAERGRDPRLDVFDGRLAALADAQNLLTRGNWGSALLAEVAARTLAGPLSGDGRLVLAGPPVELTAKQAVTLAMALHELYTNAVKYGALSDPAGRVTFEWDVRAATPPVLAMTWRETGGPKIRPPERRGFGSVLIERALAAEFDAAVRLDFAEAGLVCAVDCPLAASSPRRDDLAAAGA